MTKKHNDIVLRELNKFSGQHVRQITEICFYAQVSSHINQRPSYTRKLSKKIKLDAKIRMMNKKKENQWITVGL